MKNNTKELKPLFTNIDVKPSPMIVQGNNVGEILFNSLYNNTNDILVPHMANIKPCNVLDVELIRESLVNMFRYRAENVLNNIIKILVCRLNELETNVSKFIYEQQKGVGNYCVNIYLRYEFDILEDILKDFPYLTDLLFYFNITHDFQSIKTLALAITTKLYNQLVFNVHSDYEVLNFEELDLINERINHSFKVFSNSLIDELHVLLHEANTIYFESGDYIPLDNGDIVHYTKQNEQLNKEKQPIIEPQMVELSKDEMNERLEGLMDALKMI